MCDARDTEFKRVVDALINDHGFRKRDYEIDGMGNRAILTNGDIGIDVLFCSRDWWAMWFVFEDKVVGPGRIPWQSLTWGGGDYLGVRLTELEGFPGWRLVHTPKQVKQYFRQCYDFLTEFLQGGTAERVFAGHKRTRWEIYTFIKRGKEIGKRIRMEFQRMMKLLASEHGFRVRHKSFGRSEQGRHRALLIGDAVGVSFEFDPRRQAFSYFVFQNKIVGKVASGLHQYLGLELTQLPDFPCWGMPVTLPEAKRYLKSASQYLLEFLSGRTPSKIFAGHRRTRRAIRTA